MMHLLDGRRVRMNVNSLHIPWYWEISWIYLGRNNSSLLQGENSVVSTEGFQREFARKIIMEQLPPHVSSLRHHHKREYTKHTVVSVVFIFTFNYMLMISDRDSSIIQNTFHIISSFKLYLCAAYGCWQKKIIITIKHTGLDYDILTCFWDPGLLHSLNSLIHCKKEYYNLAHKDYSSKHYINSLKTRELKYILTYPVF